MPKTTGGGNRTDVFDLTSTGGKWVASTTPLISFTQKYKTPITGHEKTMNIAASIDHDYDNEDLWDDLLNVYLSEDAASASEGNYEDNSPSSPNVGDPSKLVAVVNYSAKNSSSAKRRIRVFLAEVSGGDETWEAGKAVRVKVDFKGIKITDVPLRIPSAAFNTDLVSGGTTLDVAVGSMGSTFHLTGV